MRTVILRVSLVLVTMFPALGITVVAASGPALAADSCYGDYCSGRDPNSVGVGGVPCANDARTVRSAEVNEADGFGGYYNVATLEVRWSARCGANWARLRVYREAYGLLRLYLTQDSQYAQTKKLQNVWSKTPIGGYYTYMIYSPNNAVMAWVQSKWPPSCSVCSTTWV